jgi:uncharacterized BrkB/YihY/UPF0761 family membrane protein
VDFAFTASEHDRNSAGALLAGALAFRLFLWLLPAALVLFGCLGFVPPNEVGAGAVAAGLGDVGAAGLEKIASQAHEGRWFLLLFGLVLLYSASATLARTLWVATTLAWQLPIVRLVRTTRAAAFVTIGFLAAGVGALGANWLRDQSYLWGMVATGLLVVVFVLLGWATLAHLPHPAETSLWGLLPGALVLGVGAQIVHLVAVVYLDSRISSELYGALGGAATLLLWGYLLARVLVGASTVNRTWHTSPPFRVQAARNGT